jgi:hypothetical protein
MRARRAAGVSDPTTNRGKEQGVVVVAVAAMLGVRGVAY